MKRIGQADLNVIILSRYLMVAQMFLRIPDHYVKPATMKDMSKFAE